MFGKLGRGGGGARGSSKRPLVTPVPLHRPVAGGGSGGARLPISTSAPGKSRRGTSGDSNALAATGRDETFTLEPGELDFGAIIRLTPDLVEEIRRLEAEGGAARIKFDANANNTAGNVIDVGGKEFRFTWSRELTDLCDIYEQRQSGEDGDGLLLECGSAWRKLNVERILDESTKNHVKMRSEEAERMLKSRKAIVLDPTNPSVKNQAKSMAAAAVEGNMRRMGWKKEMLFKKRKVETQVATVVAQPKTIFKSITASSGNPKVIPLASPAQSSPLQPRPRTPLSLSGNGVGEVIPPININKEEVDIFEKEMPTGVVPSSMHEIDAFNGAKKDTPIDMRSILTTLLSQNPKGMSLKALEKAVGRMVPTSVKEIENVLEKIATFQAPGRYFLKQESSKRSYKSGGSPESSENHTLKASSEISKKVNDERLDPKTQLCSRQEEELDSFERVDIMLDAEDPLSEDKKVNEKDDDLTRSSSESGSGSGSESDSSDSGSDSESQSRSRSPARSGSASSSDSESDGSSSSKEASDVDVDIMTSDDEKGVALPRLEATESRLSLSPRAWRSDGEHDIILDNNERGEKSDGLCPVTGSADFEASHEMLNSVSNAKTAEIDDSYLHQSKSRFNAVHFSPGSNKFVEIHQSSHFENFDKDQDKLCENISINEKQTTMKDRSSYEKLVNKERVTKTSSNRSSNSGCFQEKPDNAKKRKASNSAEASLGKVKRASSSENSCYMSPETSKFGDQTMKTNSRNQVDERRETYVLERSLAENARTTASGSHNVCSPDIRFASSIGAEQSGHRFSDYNYKKRTFDNMGKPIKYIENFQKTDKHLGALSGPSDTDTSTAKNKRVKDRIASLKDKPDENGDEKFLSKYAKESIVGDRISSSPDQFTRKSTDYYPSHLPNSENGQGNILRRDLSDLELGEFREPHREEVGEVKRQFERKNSSKKMEYKVSASDLNTNMNMERCNGNAVSELKKQSPVSLRGGVNGKFVAHNGIDLRSQSRAVHQYNQQSARVDLSDCDNMTHFEKSTESGVKHDMRTNQLVVAENQASAQKKSTATKVLKDDSRYRGLAGDTNVESKSQTSSNGLKVSSKKGINGYSIENGIDKRKSMEFSSDEDDAFYMKYEKEDQCLRGPIKDFSMFKEYVQEYQEKYVHYCLLNKKLEGNRNEFLKVGNDIEHAKQRDLLEYNNLVDKLRQMYSHHGKKHKQMKKVFLLLHEHLKTLKQRIKDFADAHSVE